MCIAIANPEGKEIPREVLQNCWEANSDGAGFAVARNNAVEIHKGFMEFNDFYRSYEKFKGVPAILHFRIKTHGSVKPENCHPFKVNDSLAFIHNGIISSVTNRLEPDEVDTQAFNRIFLQKLPPDFYKDEVVMELISDYIGGSKLVFIDKHSNITIANTDRGVWEDGVWYSNSSYKPRPKIVPFKAQQGPISKTDVLAVDDWVKLTRDIWTSPFGVHGSRPIKKKAGDLGLVTGFSQYGIIVMLEDDVEYTITPYSVEKVYVDMLDNTVDDYYNESFYNIKREIQ